MTVITRVRGWLCDTGAGRNYLFVALESSDGHVGWGEGSQSDQDGAVLSVLRQLSDDVVGRDPLDLVESIVSWLWSNRSGRAMSIAISAVETAIWDLIGQITERPVFQLLGGSCHERLRCYATIAAGVAIDSTDAVLRESKRCVQEGFTALKIVTFPFGPPSQLLTGDVRLDIDRGLSLLSGVRDETNSTVDLLAECNFRLSVPVAISVARRLEEIGVLWMEAPLWADDPTALRQLKGRTSVAIASGELLHGRQAYVQLIEQRAVDVVQPDVKWTGGILEAKKIASWAEAHLISVAPHNNSGPVATAASAHLAMTLPNFALLEVASRQPDWLGDAMASPPLVVDGEITKDRLATSVGLGVSLDTAVLDRHAVAWVHEAPGI